MYQNMIRNADSNFVRWAIDALLKWRNEIAPIPLWHIHGSHDGVFPISLIMPTHVIRKGGHNLLMTNKNEINIILSEILSTIKTDKQFYS